MEHRILKLWTRAVSGGPMLPQEALQLDADGGVVGDHAFGHERHVTIVFQDDWNAAAREVGREVDPAGRRANVLVSGGNGIRFNGDRVNLGNAVIEIRGVTAPCGLMEDAAPGMKAALTPDGRSGLWGVVIESGAVRPGDALLRHE